MGRLITVVTVCYNAEQYIEDTLRSIKDQTFKDYEYVIIDGKSTDATLRIVEKYRDEFFDLKVYSEKDSGIYNAMNKGIDKANGKYIIFMNAGDSFYSGEILEKVRKILLKDCYDVVYGKTLITDGKRSWTNKEKMNFLLLLRSTTLCHQAIFTKTEWLKTRKFEERYAICADREWLYWAYKKKLRFKYVNLHICRYDNNGVSSQKSKRDAEREIILKKYFPHIARMRNTILRLLRNGNQTNENL